MGGVYFRNRGWGEFASDVLSSLYSPTLLKKRHVDTKYAFYLLPGRRNKSIVSFLVFLFHNPMQNDYLYFEQSFWTHLRPGGLHSQASVSVPDARIFFLLTRDARIKRVEIFLGRILFDDVILLFLLPRDAQCWVAGRNSAFIQSRQRIHNPIPPALNLTKSGRIRPGGLHSQASVSVPDARILFSHYRETRTAI